MIRTWEELKAYTITQGLVAGTGVTEQDISYITPEGLQVLIMLLTMQSASDFIEIRVPARLLVHTFMSLPDKEARSATSIPIDEYKAAIVALYDDDDDA